MPRLVALPSLPMSASSEALACKLTCQGLQQLSSSFRCGSDKQIFSHKDWKREPLTLIYKDDFFFSVCKTWLVLK